MSSSMSQLNQHSSQAEGRLNMEFRFPARADESDNFSMVSSQSSDDLLPRDLFSTRSLSSGPSAMSIPPLRPNQPRTSAAMPSDPSWIIAMQDPQIVDPKRDAAAIQYSKNRLDSGDTLVVTSRCGDSAMLFDPLGFVLDSEYIVHSEKLLATGSSYFKKMLGEEQQKKLRMSSTLAGRANAEGIKFVLDLSPENEDGEVLLHELSCPEGIRYWFRSSARNETLTALVYGREETDSLMIDGRSPIEVLRDEEEKAKEEDSFTTTAKSPFMKKQEDTDVDRLKLRGMSSYPPDKQVKSAQLQYLEANVPLDYTRARHRACVERMLQIIEGKHARLDSATKVWTTAMLAGMYDCGSAVVDEITSWVYTETNSCIIEILPEAIFKLGITLKSYMLTRAAFSILVAEEAFCMRPDTAPSQRANVTPLGRYRDDHTLGEDHLDMIQKAALVFNEQIMLAMDDFLSPHLPWFETLPEFKKLQAAKGRMEDDFGFNQTSACGVAIAAIEAVEKQLRDYYYGGLMVNFTRGVTGVEGSFAITHRTREHWSSDPRLDFEEYYEALDSRQKLCVRPFWFLVQRFKPGVIHENNITLADRRSLPDGVKVITGKSVYAMADTANMGIFGYAVRDSLELPKDAPSDDKSVLGMDRHKILETQYLDSVFKGYTPTEAQCLAHEYTTLQETNVAHSQSVFFSVYQFCREASRHIDSIASMMLQRNEDCNGFSISEGIQNLNDHQYKFLPLWAGGCDDGSGGVGVDIPLPSLDDWEGVEGGVWVGTNTATAGASTYRGADDDDKQSSVDFGSQAFERLRLMSPKRDKGKGRPVESQADSFSEVGYSAAVSEISFASTFDGEVVRSGVPLLAGVGGHEQKKVNNEALDAVMSDDFMLEGDEELDIDSDSSDEFEMLDEDDEGEKTETED